MRKIIATVLLTCFLMVLSDIAVTRVCGDADVWFYYKPNIHDPQVDNDGDGYYESVTLCIGVRTTYVRKFYEKVYGRDENGVEHFIMQTDLQETEWNGVNYQYFGHAKLVVSKADIWDFRLELYDANDNLHDAVNYGDEPTLTNVKMECELMVLVVRGSDNRIYYRIYDSAGSGSWGTWRKVPTGATIDCPAACAWHDGTLQIVVRGTDGNSLWHCSVNLTDNSFSGWDRVKGATNSRPTLCEDTLLVRGLDNHVYYSFYDTCYKTFGYKWNTVPTGSTCDGPSASWWGSDLHMVVRGTDGNTLWHGNLTFGVPSPVPFSGWHLVSGVTHVPPTLTDWVRLGSISKGYYCLPNALYLIVRGLDDSIYYRSYNGNTWQGWTKVLSGATSDSPAATTIGNTLHLVVRGMDGHSLWHGHINLTTGTFSGWTLLSGSTPSAPTLTS